jgi:hypothetical protein
MLFGHVRETFSERQGRKPIASAPEIWCRSAMPKETVVLLGTGFQQEVAICIQILLVSGNLVGTSTHRRNEKHIFTAEVWMARIRRGSILELTVGVSSFQQ